MSTISITDKFQTQWLKMVLFASKKDHIGLKIDQKGLKKSIFGSKMPELGAAPPPPLPKTCFCGFGGFPHFLLPDSQLFLTNWETQIMTWQSESDSICNSCDVFFFSPFSICEVWVGPKEVLKPVALQVLRQRYSARSARSIAGSQHSPAHSGRHLCLRLTPLIATL